MEPLGYALGLTQWRIPEAVHLPTRGGLLSLEHETTDESRMISVFPRLLEQTVLEHRPGGRPPLDGVERGKKKWNVCELGAKHLNGCWIMRRHLVKWNRATHLSKSSVKSCKQTYPDALWNSLFKFLVRKWSLMVLCTGYIDSVLKGCSDLSKKPATKTHTHTF